MANKPQEFDELEIEEPEGDEVEIEEFDDTPEEDRDRTPMPKEIVEELENDELGEYSDKVKERLKRLKKVWHDERREKEREAREKAEAINTARRLLEENRRLKSMNSKGEETLVSTYKQAAEMEIEAAKRDYREAHEAGDTEKALAAQEKLFAASFKLQQVANYKPTLQEEEDEVEPVQQPSNVPTPDAKTLAWQERNTWYGTDDEMTASALGLHQKLVRERGPQFAGTDEYWTTIDKTMRRRFPEYFDDDVEVSAPKDVARKKSVVAPASRSRSPKKIALSKTQVALAKKLGITPEQYARELLKLEGN